MVTPACLRSLGTRAFPYGLLLVAACGTTFTEAPAAGGDGGAGGDAGLDAAADPCAPVPGVGTFCVEVTAGPGAPPYDSAAQKLGLDGRGAIYVSLYDKDPSEIGSTVAPLATIRYPETAGAEIPIHSLPVTVAGTARPGTYWYTAAFQDTASARAVGPNLGDYVTSVAVDLGTRRYKVPKVTLADGAVRRERIEVSAVRRLDLALRSAIDPASLTAVANGDGPAVVAFFDGDVSSPNVLGFGGVPCLSLRPRQGGQVTASVPTPVVGSHQMVVQVYDWTVPTGGEAPPGTFTTSAPLGVSISGGAWLAKASVELNHLVPTSAEPSSDPIRCP